MAISFHQLGKYSAAERSYLHVLKDHLLARLDRTDEAIESLQVARHLAPQSTECLATLASLLRRAGRGDEATEVLEAWTTLAPDDPVPRHLLVAHRSGDVTERASDEYVRAVFDRFASSFDTDLERLQYQGPQIMAASSSRERKRESRLRGECFRRNVPRRLLCPAR